MCGANYHVSERTPIWGTVRNRGTMRSNSHQTGGESRDCTNEDNFFFLSQDPGEMRLDRGIREELKTTGANWVQWTGVRRVRKYCRQ